MTFYIKIDKNLQTIGDPFVESNLKKLFPTHYWNSGLPPSGWIECELTNPPTLDIYEKFDEAYPKHYFFKVENGKAKKEWAVQNLNDSEKKALQDAVKKEWADEDRTGYESWTFDETYCCYFPPSIYPNDGKSYEWDTANQNWKEVTE